jgi:hypothetical protein
MISVVIPTYNGIEHLKICFDSLLNQTIDSKTLKLNEDYRIVLVDNGSIDNTVDFVKNNYNNIELICLGSNTGFAKAVNEGIKHSLTDRNISHILLLNNDIECKNDFLDKMLKGFVADNVGSVACKMLNYFDRNKIDDVGDFINLIGSPYARGHAETDKGQYNKPEYIFGACAGAALYKREVFQKVGFFDEDFFAYYEDVDFSLRMQMYGYKCFYNPEAECYHKRGATTSYKSGFQTKLCEQNLVTLRIKNYPLLTYMQLQPLYAIARIKRYFSFFFRYEYSLFFKAVSGYFNGLKQFPGSIKKRRKILSEVNISNSEFKKLFKKD